MIFCVTTTSLQWEAEVCRDRVWLIGVATGLGLSAVPGQARAIERTTELASFATVRAALGDRVPGARATAHDNALSAHDNVLSAHDRPTIVHTVVHCFGHYSWTLFIDTIHEHCSWALLKKKSTKMTPGN